LLSDDALPRLYPCTVFVYDDPILGVAPPCRDLHPAGAGVFDAVFQTV